MYIFLIQQGINLTKKLLHYYLNFIRNNGLILQTTLQTRIQKKDCFSSMDNLSWFAVSYTGQVLLIF